MKGQLRLVRYLLETNVRRGVRREKVVEPGLRRAKAVFLLLERIVVSGLAHVESYDEDLAGWVTWGDSAKSITAVKCAGW